MKSFFANVFVCSEISGDGYTMCGLIFVEIKFYDRTIYRWWRIPIMTILITILAGLATDNGRSRVNCFFCWKSNTSDELNFIQCVLNVLSNRSWKCCILNSCIGFWIDQTTLELLSITFYGNIELETYFGGGDNSPFVRGVLSWISSEAF